MIEIIIIIAVVKAFTRVAGSKGRSSIAWGIVGALSYYGPILLMSFLLFPLFPLVVQAGMLPLITQDNYIIVGMVVNLTTGVLCCMVAYGILKSLPSTSQTYLENEGDRPPIGHDDGNPYRPNF